MNNKIKLHYIFDAYCGWCYGFEEILKPFLEAHPELEADVISGGLFTMGQTLSAYPHMEGANQRIAQAFGVSFGEPYQKLLQDGRMIPDSVDAAWGFSILRDMLPAKEQVNLAARMQRAFYQEGRSLSDVETYQLIGAEYKLSGEEIEAQFSSIRKEHADHPDFLKARSYGVTAFPTLIAEVKDQFYDLKGNAMTLEQLEDNLSRLRELSGMIQHSQREEGNACRIDGSGSC